MRRENKGFTLIELIITVAIIAIFSATVVNFVTVGSNSYRNTSKTSAAQMDAQDIMDRIQDLIIDTNCGAGYASGTTESDQRTPILNDIDKEQSAGAKVMMFWNAEQGEDGKVSYRADVLAWTGADDAKLYYGQSVPDTEIAEGEDIQQALNKISVELEELDMITDNLVGFEADLSKIADENAVRFKLTVDHSGKQVSLLQTVTLRNRIQIVNYLGEISSVDESDPGYAELEIFSKDKTVNPGGTCKAAVSYFRGINVRTIQWKVNGNGTIAGNFTDAVLTASKDAKDGDIIKIQASAEKSVQTQALEDGSGGNTIESNEISFKVEKTNYVIGLQSDLKELLLPAGETVRLNEILKFSYIRENDLPENAAAAAENDGTAGGESASDDIDIKWSIISPCTFAWIGSSDGRFYARQWAGKEEDSGSVTVRASSKTPDRGITVTCDIEIKLAHIEIVHPENHSVHFVGDPKYYTYNYYEAGKQMPLESAGGDLSVTIQKVVNGTTIDDNTNTWSTQEPAEDKEAYKTFTTEDVTENPNESSWHLKISYKLPTGRGHGKVTAENIFYVHNHPGNQGGELLIRNDEDCVALQRGETYRCMTTDGWGIRYVIPEQYTHIWDYDVAWSVSGTQDAATSVTTESGNKHAASLHVGEKEKKFKLTAEYTGIDQGQTYKATETKEIYVLTDVQVGQMVEDRFEPFESNIEIPVTKGNTYPFYLKLTLGDKDKEVIINNLNDYQILWLDAFNELGYRSEKTDSDHTAFWWTVRGDKNGPANGTSRTGAVRLLNTPQVFITNHEGKNSSAYISLSVWDETIDAIICKRTENTEEVTDKPENPPFQDGEQTDISMSLDESVELYLQFTRKAGALDEGLPDEREVIWKCSDRKAQITEKTGTGGKKYAEFIPSGPGEYKITAKFNYSNGAEGTAEAKVIVTTD